MAKAGVVVKDWEKELLMPVQGRLVYMGQGQCHYLHFHEATPGLLWPKKKKKAASQPPEPAEDWEAEISPPAPQEDWDAEIVASQ
jgi:hypothetical protein